jgi:hypothetical protein
MRPYVTLYLTPRRRRKLGQKPSKAIYALIDQIPSEGLPGALVSIPCRVCHKKGWVKGNPECGDCKEMSE